jgi:hypothetical protein
VFQRDAGPAVLVLQISWMALMILVRVFASRNQPSEMGE